MKRIHLKRSVLQRPTASAQLDPAGLHRGERFLQLCDCGERLWRRRCVGALQQFHHEQELLCNPTIVSRSDPRGGDAAVEHVLVTWFAAPAQRHQWLAGIGRPRVDRVADLLELVVRAIALE